MPKKNKPEKGKESTLQTEGSDQKERSSSKDKTAAEEGQRTDETRLTKAQGQEASPKQAHKKGEGGGTKRAAARINFES